MRASIWILYLSLPSSCLSLQIKLALKISNRHRFVCGFLVLFHTWKRSFDILNRMPEYQINNSWHFLHPIHLTTMYVVRCSFFIDNSTRSIIPMDLRFHQNHSNTKILDLDPVRVSLCIYNTCMDIGYVRVEKYPHSTWINFWFIFDSDFDVINSHFCRQNQSLETFSETFWAFKPSEVIIWSLTLTKFVQ